MSNLFVRHTRLLLTAHWTIKVAVLASVIVISFLKIKYDWSLRDHPFILLAVASFLAAIWTVVDYKRIIK